MKWQDLITEGTKMKGRDGQNISLQKLWEDFKTICLINKEICQWKLCYDDNDYWI
jgi:hypothetical protein